MDTPVCTTTKSDVERSAVHTTYLRIRLKTVVSTDRRLDVKTAAESERNVVQPSTVLYQIVEEINSLSILFQTLAFHPQRRMPQEDEYPIHSRDTC